MPELPEVETIRRTLAPRLVNRTVTAVKVFRPQQIRHPEPEVFQLALVGRRFQEPGRRGKYLLLHLDSGGSLCCHLRMSGRLYVAEPGPLPKHTHVVFDLDNGHELRYEDQRTFGGFHLIGPDGCGMPAGLRELGPEPFDPDWTAAYLAGKLHGRRAPVKAVLLDQSVVAGLGNIYVDELLFQAGIRADRLAGAVTPAEVERLHSGARAVLAAAIARRGTTFSLYFDGDGNPGDFYEELKVFDRTGQPCYTCGTEVRKTRVAGRGTHYCPRCQQ